MTDAGVTALLGLLFLGAAVLVWATRPKTRKEERVLRRQNRTGRYRSPYAFLDTRSGAAVGTVVCAGAGVYLLGLAVAGLIELLTDGA